MASILNALHEQADEDNLESEDSNNPGDRPQNVIHDSLSSGLASTSRFGQEQIILPAPESMKNLTNSIGAIGNNFKGKVNNTLEDQAKAAGLTGIKFGMPSALKGVQQSKELVLSTTLTKIKETTNDVFKGDSFGIEVVKNSLEDNLKDQFDLKNQGKQLKEVKQVMTKELEGNIQLTDSIENQLKLEINNKTKEELKQIGLASGIKDGWKISGDKLKSQLQKQITGKLEDKIEGINELGNTMKSNISKGLNVSEKDLVTTLGGDKNYQIKPDQIQDAITLKIPGNIINNNINSMNINTKILEPLSENNENIINIPKTITNSMFQGLQNTGMKTPKKQTNLVNIGQALSSPFQKQEIIPNRQARQLEDDYYDEEKQRSSTKFINNRLQKPLEDCINTVDERTPDEEVAGRNSSGNPFIFHNQEVPFDNPNIEKNNINNYSVISRMKGSEYQSRIDVPTVDLNLRQQQTFELQLRELQSQNQQLNQGQSQLNQNLHQYYQPPNQLQIEQPSGLRAQPQQYYQQQVYQESSSYPQTISNLPGQLPQQQQFNPQKLPQPSKATENRNSNIKDNISAIQPLELPKIKQLMNKNILKLLPWLLLAIIGLWTIIFMIAQIAYFSSFSFIKQNTQEQVADWYSTNLDLLKPALQINTGLDHNTITLVDFLIYFVITKIVYAIWLSEDYVGSGVCKDFLVLLFLLKDIAVIILSLTAGSYSNSAKGWSNFGFYWLSSQFSQQKTSCIGVLRNWGDSLYNWAQSKQGKSPELVIIGIFIGIIYLPLVFHLIVGVIEFTYIIIIWISILFLLQQIISSAFSLCQPKQKNQTLTQRLFGNQKQGINDQLDKYWAFFLPLIVLAPSVSSASFNDNFEYSIKFFLSGSQLILNYFSIPSGNASYADTLSFICNLLSVF